MSKARRTRTAEHLLIRTPDDWLDQHATMPDALADELVRQLRAAGALLWLAPQPDSTVRCRILLPVDPPERFTRLISEFMRPISKAIARLGPDVPPADNPFGDLPLPPGGHWDWLEDVQK